MEKVNNDIYDAYGDRWYTADDDPVALLRAESKTKTPWIIEKIKEHGYLNAETRVLDVGCGSGFLSNDLARNGLHVTGVDLSEESLKVAKKYDETKSTNIFAFFTQMIKNDLMQHHKKLYHKKELYVSLDSLFSNNQNN